MPSAHSRRPPACAAEAFQGDGGLVRLTAADAGLDQFDQRRPVGQDVLVLARPLRGLERLAVATVAVAQHRRHPRQHADRARPRRAPSPSGRTSARPAAPDRRVTRRASKPGVFRSSAVAWVIVSTSSIRAAAVAKARSGRAARRGSGHDREQAQRAGVTRDAHTAVGHEFVPELVVPQVLRQPARQPQPAPVRSAAVGSGERVQRLRDRLHARRIPLGEPRHEPVQERLGGARSLRSARGARGLGHLPRVRTTAHAPGVDRRRDRFQVRLAGHRRVERLEPAGGVEQERRSVAPARAGERDLRAQQLQARALELVERARARPWRAAPRAAAGAPASSLACAAASARVAAPRRIGGQLGRALQERRGRGDAAAAPARDRPSAPARRRPPRRAPRPRARDATHVDRDPPRDRWPRRARRGPRGGRSGGAAR